jgi:hypothetical protein
MLLQVNRDAGVDVRDDCRVAKFEFGASLHRLEIQSAAAPRWLKAAG